MKSNIQDKPLFSVKTLDSQILAQLWSTRGELDDTPDPVRPDETAIGYLISGGGIIIRHNVTGRLRLSWPSRYLRGLGLNGTGGFKEHLDTLAQIFVQ